MVRYHVEHIDPSARNSSHALALELAGTGSSVLDVGCATGYLGAALKARGCTVVGIERDASAAAEASEVLDEVIVADLMALPVDAIVGRRTFDTIIFADVLEHLIDPDAVLASAVRALAPGGSIVISIPNVSHGSVRLALAQGRWQYTDVGILDRTHLRFYTAESVVDLVHGAGLAIRDLLATVVDPLGTDMEIDVDSLPEALPDWIRQQPAAFDFQYLVRAQVPDEREDRVPAPIPVPVVDPETVSPPAEEVADRLARALGESVAVGELVRARLDLLHRRDARIGAEAALEVARQEAERQLAEAEALRAEVESLTAELGELRRELEASRVEVAETRAEQGCHEAELERLRTELAVSRTESVLAHEATARSRAEAEIATEAARRVTADHAGALAEIRALRSSTTWRVGRILVAPLARVRGLVGRR